jgi:hypothetical protein
MRAIGAAVKRQSEAGKIIGRRIRRLGWTTFAGVIAAVLAEGALFVATPLGVLVAKLTLVVALVIAVILSVQNALLWRRQRETRRAYQGISDAEATLAVMERALLMRAQSWHDDRLFATPMVLTGEGWHCDVEPDDIARLTVERDAIMAEAERIRGLYPTPPN